MQKHQKDGSFVQVCYGKACTSFGGDVAYLMAGALSAALGIWLAAKIQKTVKAKV